MAAHNHHDLMNWKNGLLKGQPNKPSNKKIVVAIIIGLVLVGAYTLYSKTETTALPIVVNLAQVASSW